MKKILAILICITMLVVTFVACDEPIAVEDRSDATNAEQGDDSQNTDKVEESEDAKATDEENKATEEDKTEEVKPLAPLPESSEGLKFKLNDDQKGYTLVHIGDCQSTTIIIGKYNGLPVTAIGANMRMYQNAHTVYIGHSVTKLYPENFLDSFNSWDRITVQEGNPVYSGAGGCLIEKATKTLLVGASSSVIPDDGSVETIGEKAFYQCWNLKKVVIPDSVTKIEDNAFHSARCMTELVLSKNLKSIGNGAFNGCEMLEGDLVIPETVTFIGEAAFGGVALKSVTIPASIKRIPTAMFAGSDLENVTIMPGIEVVGNKAFQYCNDLESIVIPEGVTTIEDDAFFHCSDLLHVSLPNSLINITSYSSVFESCESLVRNEYKGGYYLGNESNPYVYLINGKTSYSEIHPETRIIGPTAFGNFVGPELFIPAKVHTMYADSFIIRKGTITSIEVDKNNTTYHSVSDCIIETATGTVLYGREVSVIPDHESITVLGKEAFALCRSLTSIVIPKNIKEIGGSCFASCSALTEIRFEGTKDEWRAIVKGKDWNYDCGNYVIKCTDGDIAKADDK